MKKSKVQPQPGDKVLWIRFSAFGDVLQAAAAAQCFKKKYPGINLTFMTLPMYAGILDVQPYIDDRIYWDVKKRPHDFLKAIHRVRASNFDWIFSMHRVASAALIALFSGVRWRFGYNRILQFCYRGTHLEFFNAMGVDIASRNDVAIFTTQEHRDEAKTMLSSLPEKKIFAVIGASKAQKLWPVRYWKIFLREALQQGWGVILNGHGDSETSIAKEIETELHEPALLNLAGRLHFPLMAAVAQACTVAVGNDTGPLHLAALSGVPTLGFFGSTNSYRTGYRMPWFREVRVSCPYEGCRDYRCPVECLADISPEKAFGVFRDFMEF